MRKKSTTKQDPFPKSHFTEIQSHNEYTFCGACSIYISLYIDVRTSEIGALLFC